MKEGKSVWWREAAKVLCHQLLDAHQLASLLLLGLLGLEATLVSRWPQQTRRFRTSRWAQLSCRLAWMLVLLELTSLLHFKTLQDFRLQTYPSAFHRPGIMLPPSLPTLSCYLRKMLWLVNSWLHYAIFYGQPQRRKSCYHQTFVTGGEMVAFIQKQNLISKNLLYKSDYVSFPANNLSYRLFNFKL